MISETVPSTAPAFTAQDDPICEVIGNNGHRRCRVMVRNGERLNLIRREIYDDEDSRRMVAKAWAATLGCPAKEDEFLERLTKRMAALDWNRTPLPPPENPAAIPLVENVLHEVDRSPAPQPTKRKGRKRSFAEVDSSTELALPDGHSLTIARAYMDDYGGILRYWRGDWYLYRECVYVRFEREELRAKIWEYLSDATVIGEKLKVTGRMVGDVLDAMAGTMQVHGLNEIPGWIDGRKSPKPENIIAFQNGLLDSSEFLKTASARLIPASPLWFSRTVLPYSFAGAAECPQWLAFLADVMSGDADLIQLLREWFGYNLVADTRQQKALVMIGPPRSGKGTICRALRRLVGAENCTSPSLSNLGERFGLSPLVGMNSAIVPDAHLGRNADAVRVLEILKSIIGEDAQCVDRKHREPLGSVKLGVRFTLAVNELPSLPDASVAMRSRLLLMPMNKSYEGSEDRTLDERLATETPGIMRWALEGLRSLRRRKRFIEPGVSVKLRDQFSRLSSPALAFVEDCCNVDPDLFVAVDAAWDHWKKWAEATGLKVGSKEAFGIHLRAAVPAITRERKTPEGGGERFWAYQGLGLFPRIQEDQHEPQ